MLSFLFVAVVILAALLWLMQGRRPAPSEPTAGAPADRPVDPNSLAKPTSEDDAQTDDAARVDFVAPEGDVSTVPATPDDTRSKQLIQGLTGAIEVSAAGVFDGGAILDMALMLQDLEVESRPQAEANAAMVPLEPRQGGTLPVCYRVFSTECVCPGELNWHCDPVNGPIKNCTEQLVEACSPEGYCQEASGTLGVGRPRP